MVIESDTLAGDEVGAIVAYLRRLGDGERWAFGYGRIHGGSNELGILFIVGTGSLKASGYVAVHFHRLRCLLNKK